MNHEEAKEKRAKAISKKKADKRKEPDMFAKPKGGKKHRIAELRMQEIEE